MGAVGSFIRGAGRALFTGKMQTGTKVVAHDFLGSLSGLSEFNPAGKIFGKSGIKTLGGALLKKSLPYYAAGAGIDYVLNNTRAGEEMSGAGRFGLSALSLGFKANSARHLIRGATGSALYGAGALAGNPSKFRSQYAWVENKLNAAVTGGMKMVGKGAAFAATFPIKAVMGIPYAAASAVRVGANLIGSATLGSGALVGAAARGMAFGGPGALMGRLGMKTVGRSWAGVGKALEGASSRFFDNRPSIGSQLSPSRLGFLGKNLGGSTWGRKPAPVMSTFFAMGGAAGLAMSYGRYRNESKGWVPGAVSPNPSNYGGGISVMRRGPNQNYGPALTLMLHQNHSRVM